MDSTICSYFHYQLFEVGALFHTRIFDAVLYILNRSVNRVDSYDTQRSVFRTVLFRRYITAAFAYPKLYREVSARLHIAYYQFRVHYLETRQCFTYHTGSESFLAFNVQLYPVGNGFTFTYFFDTNLLQVQDNFGNIFQYAFDSCKFMICTWYPDCSKCITFQRRQQHTAQCVTYGN